MLVDARLQHWEEWLFAMFEAQRLIVRVGGIDGANDNSSLVADILPRDTSALAGAFTVLAIYTKYTEMFCLTCKTPSVIEDEIRLINVGHFVDVKYFTACTVLD